MIFEFSIPSTATTAYKRTVVLPMYFGVPGNSGYSLNAIAQEIIAADSANSISTLSAESMISTASLKTANVSTLSATAKESSSDEDTEIISDVYGNEITNGLFNISMEDVNTYLTEEEAEEFTVAAANLGISLLSLDDGVSTYATTEDGSFEPSTDTTYSFTVDWGDGSAECIFDETKTYTDNKSAIWHTYESAGVYDITINGTYKRIYTQGDDQPNLVVNGSYVQDTDGVNVINNNNYGMRNHLIAVIAWGNTLLNNMDSAFRACSKLADIPMYDTTNSFEDVTSFAYAFRRCTSLTTLPYNANTDRGLFSGCTKATTFANTFSHCTGLTQSIPVKLIDGCTNVTTVNGMFSHCSNMQGSIPTGMFAGMTSLTNASDVFANNKNMDGQISSDLFVDCPNITTIYRLFYGCTKITGTFEREFIGGLTKLTDMRQAFYNCKGITGFASDAFYGLTSNNINCRDAFYGSGITEIPEGLLESMTGNNLMMERMFGNCVSLTTIPSTALANLKVANARGMFGGCTNLASALPTANADWSTYEGMQRWYGAFANTALSDISTVCLELGGDGDRLYSEGKVGSIVLNDGTFVDPKDYVYDSSNVPIGIVYADTYIDSTTSTSTIANGAGNVVASDNANAVHKIYATVLNDTTRAWINSQVKAEDITTITNTSNVEVAYNKFTWSDDGTATRNNTRYNGEAYSKAINEWRVSKGMATYDETTNTYTATDTDVYRAIDYVNNYTTNGITKGACFLPDGADLWDQFTMKYLIQKACNKLIAGGNGYTTSNCYSMRDGTNYWASAEYSSTNAWNCSTYNAIVYYNFSNYNKWNSSYVRPSLALTA